MTCTRHIYKKTRISGIMHFYTAKRNDCMYIVWVTIADDEKMLTHLESFDAVTPLYAPLHELESSHFKLILTTVDESYIVEWSRWQLVVFLGLYIKWHRWIMCYYFFYCQIQISSVNINRGPVNLWNSCIVKPNDSIHFEVRTNFVLGRPFALCPLRSKYANMSELPVIAPNGPSMGKEDGSTFSWNEILRVQNLIERCLQQYMPQVRTTTYFTCIFHTC
jgi:hypothetical protein